MSKLTNLAFILPCWLHDMFDFPFHFEEVQFSFISSKSMSKWVYFQPLVHWFKSSCSVLSMKGWLFRFLNMKLDFAFTKIFFFFLAIWSLVIFDLSWIFLSDSLLIHSAVFSLGKVFLHLILRIEHNTPCLVTLEIGLNSFLELLLFSNIELCLVLIMHVDIFFHFSWTIYLLTWSFEMVLILILFCLHVKFGWVQLVLFLSPLFVGLKPNKFLIQPQRQVQFGLSVQQYEECIHV